MWTLRTVFQVSKSDLKVPRTKNRRKHVLRDDHLIYKKPDDDLLISRFPTFIHILILSVHFSILQGHFFRDIYWQMIAAKCVRIQATFPSIFTSIRSKSRNPFLADDFERNGRFMEKLLNRKTIQDVLNPSIGSKTAKGAPSFLVRSKGHTKTISRRQAMLNKHFLQGLTDVIATDAEIGSPFHKHQVKVTQVETGQHYNILNIYWSLPDDKLANVDSVGKELSSLAGILHKKMIERNFMGLMPRIRFNYDQNKAAIQVIESVGVQRNVRDRHHQLRHGSVDGRNKGDLKGESTKSDLNGESIKRDDEGSTQETQKVAPQPEPDHAGYTRIDPMRPRFWARKVALFVESQKYERRMSL